MIIYDLGEMVDAWSTCIGEEHKADGVVTPAHQAHSTQVARIPDEVSYTYGVDALITNSPGVRIGVRTADCVPVLLYDAHCHAAAAIHSGWKGTANDIISSTVAKMQESFGSDPQDIKAVIGPCIHLDAFEVGDEVYEEFQSKGYGKYAIKMANPFSHNSDVKWHIDLPGICREQLQRLSVTDIFTSPYCTYRHHDILYSYRYSKSTDPTQRIITSILLKKIGNSN